MDGSKRPGSYRIEPVPLTALAALIWPNTPVPGGGTPPLDPQGCYGHRRWLARNRKAPGFLSLQSGQKQRTER